MKQICFVAIGAMLIWLSGRQVFADQSKNAVFSGKTITLLVPAGAGGGYGAYALLISRFLPEEVPGHPDVKLQFVPGGGGVKASNDLMTMPRDGTALYLMHENAVSQQLLYPNRVSYDIAKFVPIELITSLNGALFVRNDVNARTLQDFKHKSIFIGATGTGSYQFMTPAVLNKEKGTRFHIVLGYPGAAELSLALQRGEVQGFLSSLTAIELSHPDWISGEGLASVVFQLGARPDALAPEAPLLSSFASSEEERATYDFVSAGASLGRSVVAAPATSPNRVAILRTAFTKLVENRDFLAAAAARHLPIHPENHSTLDNMIQHLMKTPQSVLADMRGIMKRK